MKQESGAIFKSDDGLISVIVQNGVSLGKLHDFLLKLKGHIVDRMIEVQREEEGLAAEHMQDKNEQ